MMTPRLNVLSCATVALSLCCVFQALPDSRAEDIRFTSVPDIFNWNISNPQPGWEDTLDWFFDRLQKEGPDFTLNAGDIMDARWWDEEAQVKRKTEEYWGGFMTRLMNMPKNGPANHIGRTFSVRRDNLLVITLDTFEDQGERFGYTVGKEQLTWLEKTFKANADAEFIVVQGHLPIVGPVQSKNSSRSMLDGGTDSDLWKLMVKHGVHVYLCGEHHRITVKKQDGIWQIVHGALWGTQTDLNYLRGSVRPKEMTLELLEFDVEYSGGYIGDHPHRGEKNKPRENVALAAKTKSEGPRVTGTLVLSVNSEGSVEPTKAVGWFEVNSPEKGVEPKSK